MKNDKIVALNGLKEKIDDIIDITIRIKKEGDPIDRVMKACVIQEGQSMSDFADLKRLRADLNAAFSEIHDYAIKLEMRVEAANAFIDNIEAVEFAYK